MKKRFPVMDSLNFEVRYSYGHLYLDRCGQCLIDIEKKCDGWLSLTVGPQAGELERPDKNFSLRINTQAFNFGCVRASQTDVETIANEAATLWKIIEANLGLDEFLRIGCRIKYILATESVEDSEKLLQKSEINVNIPEVINKSGFNLKKRNLTCVFEKGDLEYRMRIAGVTRQEGMNPENIIKGEPRFLSKKQNDFRIAQLKQLSQYSANPMYAVLLDVDCVATHPKKVSVKEFILNQSDIVKKEFLPFLEKL